MRDAQVLREKYKEQSQHLEQLLAQLTVRNSFNSFPIPLIDLHSTSREKQIPHIFKSYSCRKSIVKKPITAIIWPCYVSLLVDLYIPNLIFACNVV